jgi:1-deoxy-D-xylulose 5-phosphate reductoisomerase
VNRAFIEDKIPYTRISEIIEKTMQNVAFNTEDTLDNYLATDKEARAFAASLL